MRSTMSAGRWATPEIGGIVLSSKQLTILIVEGVIVWYLAALFVKYAGPLGVFNGVKLPLLYGLTIAIIYSAVLLAQWSVRVPREGVLIPVSVIAATAMLCDGIAFGWFRAFFYGADGAIASSGGGWILWGVGLSLAIAIALSLKQRHASTC